MLRPRELTVSTTDAIFGSSHSSIRVEFSCFVILCLVPFFCILSLPRVLGY